MPPPKPPAPTYVRFVCFQQLAGGRSRLGLFQARDVAIDNPHSPDWALALMVETLEWFGDNLAAPTILRRGGRRSATAQDALCWYKAEAAQHIARMHDFKNALEACGVHVEVLRTRDPGFILYEDDHQIAAEPGHRRF
jgi:hypothetical protein